MAISDLIADELRTHQTRLFRVVTNLNDFVQQRLASVGKNLISKLIQADPTEPSTHNGQQNRLKNLRSDVRAYTRTQYDQVHSKVIKDSVDLSVYDTEVVAKVVTKHAPESDLTVQPFSTRRMNQIAERAIVDGAPSADWWRRQSQKVTQDFIDTVNAGVSQGESIAQIVQDVRGTKAQNFNDGIMTVNQRNAEALVRSSVLAINNAVRLDEFKQSDVVSAVQILVTFDQRTCVICRGLSGASFNLDTGKPLPTSPYRGIMPVIPLHWQCRCLWIPLILDEQPAQDLYYEEWLKKQSAATQQDILGPSRWKMWKEAAVSLTDMVDQRGFPLSLEQLKETA